MPSAAADLARAIEAAETPRAVVDARLELAASVAGELAGAEAVVAALVVGSTALRRCSPTADLDLVVVAACEPRDGRFESRTVGGVRVEIERVGRHEALAATEGDGWVWELRHAARLGTGVPVHDPEGFAAALAARAAAMAPAPDRFQATLAAVERCLGDLAGGPVPMDALRGCLDNLVLLGLLEHPRRYQKPKWALADLVHAGELDLVDAVLAAYGDGDPLADVPALVDGALAAAGAPSCEALVAMGHAPAWAEASYVARTVDDAADLHAAGRLVEAGYVARFAARLAGGLLAAGDDAGSDDGGLAGAYGRHGMAGDYLALFPDEGVAADDLLAATLAAAGRRRSAVPA